ncbi:putative ribonuclease H-like domain-containing protein [Tanacetum coccineum]
MGYEDGILIQNAIIIFRGLYLQGNVQIGLGKDAKGNTIVHPPVSLDEHVAVQRENKVRTLLLQALPEDHMPDFHHYDDARDIWMAVKARFGGNEESKKMKKTMLKQQFTEFSVTEEEGLHKGYDRFQKILSQLNQVQARPDNDDINLKFLRALPSSCYGVKAAAAPTHSAFIGAASSGSKLTYSDQQNQDMIYEDFDQVDQLEMEELDLNWQMAMLSLWINKFKKKAGRKMNYNNQQPARFDRRKSILPLRSQKLKQNEPKLWSQVIPMVNCHHAAENKTAATEFAMMGISPKAYQNAVKTLESQKRLAQKEKKEWEVKFEATLARFEKWKESSKNLKKLINSSMSTRTKIGLGFKEYFGKDEVFDLSRPSTVYPEPIEEESDIEETHDQVFTLETYASCDSSLKTNQRLRQLLLISDLSQNSVPCKSKAATVPAGSRNSSASVTAGGSDPATRNRPAVNSAGRPNPTGRVGQAAHRAAAQSNPAGWSKSPAPVSAGRPVSAGWFNPAARPYFRPSSVYFNNMYWPELYDPMYMNEGVGSAVRTQQGDPSTDNDIVKGGHCKFGGGDGRISGKGTIRTSKLDFENVYYVEELQHFNLFSVSQICDKKNKVLFTDTDCLVLTEEFQLPDESQVVLRIPRERDLYTFSISELQPEQNVTCLVAKASLDESTRWHRRMAHVNFKTINKLAKEGLVDGLPLKVFTNEHNCVACNKGKQHKASYKHISAERLISKTLQLLHMDLFGPTNIRSIDQKYYSLVVTDDLAGYLEGSSIGHLKPFGCQVTILNTSDHLGKFEGKADEEDEAQDQRSDMVICSHKKQQKILSQAEAEIRNQVFSADRIPAGMILWCVTAGSTSAGSDPAGGNPAVSTLPPVNQWAPVTTLHIPVPSDVCMDQLSSGIFTSSSYDDDFRATLTNLAPAVEVNPVPTKRVNTIHPQSQILGDLASPVLTRSRAHKSKFGESAFIGYIQDQQRTNHTDQLHCLSACFLSQLEPTSIAKALEDPDWVDAMQEEMQQFINQQVWKLVPLPAGKHAIGTKWILKNKRDARGIVVRNKARLVAQGHRQEEGIDYDEVFAPVARIEAIRLFLAFASYMGFLVYQLDVKSAFLYGEIEEEVYVTQPKGFEDPYFPKHVYRVVKALYGLHQAPRAWYARLSAFLLQHNYRRGTIDKTLFIKKDSRDILLVQVYVDDIIFGSTNKAWCDEFEVLMKGEFEMSAMGEMNFFLGLQVKQLPDGIFISQDKYVKDMLTKFDMESVRTATTPYEAAKTKLKDETDPPVNVHLYRSMIGSLMYLTASRPDIMFAVSACSRHQVTPLTSHLNAVKKIFKYLKGQPKLGLWYPKDSPFQLEAYSDSDYAGSHGDRKSTTDGCQKSGQTVNYMAVQEADYCGYFFYRSRVCCCCELLCTDNQSTICIVKNPVFHQRTKHIEIRHHFIRDANEKNLIQVLKIHTNDNVADLLTKAFDGPRFEYLVVHIGMVVNTAARCTFFLLTGLVSAGRTMILLVVILSAGRLVSAGRTMILLVVILSAGRLVSAGRTMILLVVILSAGCFVSAGSLHSCWCNNVSAA